MANIPDFRSIVLPLFDEEITDNEFAERMIFLYHRYEQVRAITEDCDISAVISLLQDKGGDRNKNRFVYPYVIISGNNVNLRNFPSLNSTVLSQASEGETYPIDVVEFNMLSESQQADVITGNGWFPIFLSTGKKGYVYSQYGRLYSQ